MVEKIKEYFFDGIFSPPAQESDIINVEKVLGIKMPRALHELYLAFDGFREGIGNSAYLLPLFENRGSSSVTEINKFIWDEYKEYYPNLNLEKYLFFGISSGDENWGINLVNHAEIIAYHHHMEDEYKVVGNDIFDLFVQDQKRYRE